MLTRHVRPRPALALIGAAAAWGIATAVAKYAVDEIPPTILLPVQLAASLAVFGPLAVLRHERTPWSSRLRRLGSLGVLNPGISYALSLFGLASITASLSVLLWATEPMLIIGFAWVLLGERVDLRTAVATLVALVGVVLVVFEGGEGEPFGVVLTLAGVAACAVYTIVTRKWLASQSMIQVVMAQQAAALGFALVLAVAAGAASGSGIPDASQAAWISAVGSGILYYGVAFWLYLTGLRQLPATAAGLFLTLIPVFGVIAGHVFLDERLDPRQWIGAMLIVVALAATQRRLPDPPPEVGAPGAGPGRSSAGTGLTAESAPARRRVLRGHP